MQYWLKSVELKLTNTSSLFTHKIAILCNTSVNLNSRSFHQYFTVNVQRPGVFCKCTNCIS